MDPGIFQVYSQGFWVHFRCFPGLFPTFSWCFSSPEQGNYGKPGLGKGTGMDPGIFPSLFLVFFGQFLVVLGTIPGIFWVYSQFFPAVFPHWDKEITENQDWEGGWEWILVYSRNFPNLFLVFSQFILCGFGAIPGLIPGGFWG